MTISLGYWHLVVKNGKYHIATDIQLSRMAISHCYWHLSGEEWHFHMATHIWWFKIVKNGNFTCLLTSSGQEWQFHMSTDISLSRMAISHCYSHLSCQEWQVSTCATNISVVKNGNFTLSTGHLEVKNAISHCLLTSSGQEWQFHMATDI